jgi:hypothetical protein
MERIKVRQLGEFGYDVNDDLKTPGLYTIPIPDYMDREDGDGYEWIDVDIRKVLLPPDTRLHTIIGYDENGESQMWYYNGNQKCFKRIWQDGVMGGGSWKDKPNVVEYLMDDVEVTDEDEAESIADWFLSL